jgi:hypothetical protein
MNGASAALSDPASELRAEQPEGVPQDPEQRRVGGDIHLV